MDRMRTPVTLALVLAAALHGAAAAAASAEVAHVAVEIPRDGGVLKSILFKPEGAGPFPTVVALHACGGLFTRSSAIATRYRDWAEHLVKAGFVVLFPDSYGSRGLGPQCGVRQRAARTDHERVADANAARHWLQTQSYVTPGHVALLGWSSGAITALWTVRRAARPKDKQDDFRSAVALYPSCRRLDNAAWSARVPTLILIGAADDWTSAQLCQRMVADARGRSAGTAIVVYPGTYHDFDHPNRPLQLRGGYALASDTTGSIHTGTNQAARADALRRVPQWLAR